MGNRRREAAALVSGKIAECAHREGIAQAALGQGCVHSTVERLVRGYQQQGLWALCNQPRGPRV